MTDPKTHPVDGFAEIDFNAEPFLTDARNVFERMHSGGCPYAHSSNGDHYAVASYAEIVALLKQHSIWKARFGPGLTYLEAPGVLTSVDPPDHAFEARLVAGVLSAEVFEAMLPALEGFINHQIDRVFDAGSADLHEVLSIPQPLFVIFRLLGLDRCDEDGSDRFSWINKGVIGQVSLMYLTKMQTVLHIASGRISEEMVRAVVRTQDLLKIHLQKCKAKLDSGVWESNANLVTRFLTATTPAGDSLSDEKIIGFMSFLMVAGTATITSMLSNVLHRLLTEDGAYERVRDNPDMIPIAIEESLRLDAPVRGMFRTNDEETRLGSTRLEKDTKVLLLWGAANLDPQVFEDPMTFSLDRDLGSVRRHLSFGYGTHFCRGAPLARLEGEVFLKIVLDRLEGLRLNGAVVPETRAPILQCIRKLPVAWNTD